MGHLIAGKIIDSTIHLKRQVKRSFRVLVTVAKASEGWSNQLLGYDISPPNLSLLSIIYTAPYICILY